MSAFSEQVGLALQDAAPEGLQRLTDTRWIGEPQDGIRKILEFQALKGGQYSARWGFSVDFVPRVRGAALSWKRAAKAAVFDLCIDPIDLEGQPPSWCAFTADVRADQLEKIVRAVREQASRDLARVKSPHDLLDLFQDRARLRFRRFALGDYVQTDLAWGLLQLATGDVEGGNPRIAAFCEQFGVDPAASILVEARQEALRQPHAV